MNANNEVIKESLAETDNVREYKNLQYRMPVYTYYQGEVPERRVLPASRHQHSRTSYTDALDLIQEQKEAPI